MLTLCNRAVNEELLEPVPSEDSSHPLLCFFLLYVLRGNQRAFMEHRSTVHLLCVRGVAVGSTASH